MTTRPKAEELDTLENLAARVVERALEGGVDHAEAVARSGSELSTKIRLGEPELVEEAGYRGLGLRVMKQQRVALLSTSDLTDAGIDRFIDDALELVEVAQKDSFAGPADPDLIAKSFEVPADMFDPAVEGVDAAQALDVARRAEAAAQAADARITNSEGATFTRVDGAFSMVLSGGFRGGYASTFASLAVSMVADDENHKKRTGYHWTARRFLAELDAAESVGEEAARRTVRFLGARPVASCEAPVIFDPDAGRSIIGLLASCVMGSSIWKQRSYLRGRLGTQVASELVTLVDDPTLGKSPGSRPFDGEGLASRRNVVVNEGKLETYLLDSYSGRKLKMASTASASRGGGGGVGPSTTNFMLQAGGTPADDIVKSTKRGLYVTNMMGFGFNPVTGDFSRGASGFWIENGEIVHPVTEVTISLNVDELFKRIDAIGDDLDVERTSTAAPTFRVSSMTIGGT